MTLLKKEKARDLIVGKFKFRNVFIIRGLHGLKLLRFIVFSALLSLISFPSFFTPLRRPFQQKKHPSFLSDTWFNRSLSVHH